MRLVSSVHKPDRPSNTVSNTVETVKIVQYGDAGVLYNQLRMLKGLTCETENVVDCPDVLRD